MTPGQAYAMLEAYKGGAKMTLAVILKRQKNGKTHITRLKKDGVHMHLDIIQSIIDRLIERGSNPAYIDILLENGYQRADY